MLILVYLMLGSACLPGVLPFDTWTYGGQKGPDNWPLVCATGMSQSPVDIDSCETVHKPISHFTLENYDVSVLVDIINNGHTAKLMPRSTNITMSGGGLSHSYTFAQAHFHWGLGAPSKKIGKRDVSETSPDDQILEHEDQESRSSQKENLKPVEPVLKKEDKKVENEEPAPGPEVSDSGYGSEHRVNGIGYPLEVHLVHYNTKYKDISVAVQYQDGLAVLGIMFHISDTENQDIQPILEILPTITKPQSQNTLRFPFSMDKLLPGDISKFYRYSGSLTTPGCYEVVTWSVFFESIPISEPQLKIFRELVNLEGKRMVNNHRPVQPINSRTIFRSTKTDRKCTGAKRKEIKIDSSKDLITFAMTSVTSITAIFATFGAATLELAFSRSKKDIVLGKYVLCLLASSLSYWFTGFGIAWGNSAAGVTGTTFFATTDPEGVYQILSELVYPIFTSFLFLLALSTERVTTRYLVCTTVLISGIFFPLVDHWTENSDGWLHKLGYTDHGGCLHLFVASMSLVSLRMISKVHASPPTTTKNPNLTAVILGTFILVFSMILQNISKIKDEDTTVLLGVLNIILAMSAASATESVVNKISKREKDRSKTTLSLMNAMLTAAVAVKSGCEIIPTWSAVVAGLGSAPLYYASTLQFKKFGIHDEAEVIAVHGVGGLLGMVVLPLFRQDDLGLFYNGGLDAATGLGMNLVGTLVVLALGAIASFGISFLATKLNMFIKIQEYEYSGNSVEKGIKDISKENIGEILPLKLGDVDDSFRVKELTFIDAENQESVTSNRSNL
ncbi:uncharacterized protein LOC111701634 isoform X2 [Eurytemora carolleeae]|uniref:uncharacterized protein LOC111701634 isoform X2 n=1 Tax=Eurytemora carolleeae TaxID=1294199 RepID=UPI000C790D92|nr:uncharacterized protein LOC111701634 isoform X2 [Eurytemora carolleeae]|eukprot:XP_023328777.1 uncharacterized protein LOC111701634 isoform X2 [Eurytemora affinis]